MSAIFRYLVPFLPPLIFFTSVNLLAFFGILLKLKL